MGNQEILMKKIIGDYEEIEKSVKEQILEYDETFGDIIDWDDESLLMMKRLLKISNSYKELLLEQAKQNDYLVNTITDINNKLDKLVDRA